MASKFRKFLYSLFTIFLAITAIFFVIRLSPGDPVEKILGPEASQVEITKYREQLGLNLSVGTQYLNYMKGFLTGDLGQSLFKKKSVVELLKTHLPPSIILAIVATMFSSILGVLFGVISAARKSSGFDFTFRFISLIALSFPIFSLAPILVLIFSIKLNLLPVSEWTSIAHGVLPCLTLIIPLSSVLSRVTRNKFLEEEHGPWVRVLTAKGLSDYAVIWRVAKVCLPSVFNVVAIQLSVVLAGTMITETIFDIPGIGSLLFEGIQNRDYPVVQGIIIYSTVIYMGVYFFIDIINEFIDPRIRS
ncbi:MAG: ABC transporter permease [Oligoflexia bacterium]|nr:ABC transporter permease [Oligoflexia bacterium]